MPSLNSRLSGIKTKQVGSVTFKNLDDGEERKEGNQKMYKIHSLPALNLSPSKSSNEKVNTFTAQTITTPNIPISTLVP